MANEKRLDLIDRGALMNDISQMGVVSVGNVLQCLSVAKTVDAVEVVHGHWVKLGKHDWACSVCKRGVPYSYTGFHYCPNCGAKMDGDGNAQKN